MPTPTPHASEAEAQAEAFAKAVIDFLKEDDRPLEWLVRKSGISGSTLRRQLIEKPRLLTYVNSVRIARVVPVQPLREDVAA